MPQLYKAILGAAAASLTLGAVQLAFGHDLAERLQAVSDKPIQSVNRAAKADRIADVRPSAVPTRTMSLRLHNLADTSVLLRMPLVEAKGSRPGAEPPALPQTRSRKPTLACEPMVSSLTEVAKILQPGRCVT